MKTVLIFAFVILLFGFAFAGSIPFSIMVTPTSGSAGSSFTVTITNHASLALPGIKLYFGSDVLTPSEVSENNCEYSSTGITLGPSESSTCTYTVPQLPPGTYALSAKSTPAVYAVQAAQPFYITTSSIDYDSLLAKIPIGTKIPSQFSLFIGDGTYQGYVVNSGTNMSRCTASDLNSSQIKYEATVTISGGEITSVSKGTTANPNMEMCLTDTAINALQNSTDPETTVNQELQSNNMGYTVDNFIQSFELGVVHFLGSLLGGQYAQASSILSFGNRLL